MYNGLREISIRNGFEAPLRSKCTMGNAKSQSETGLKPLSQFENSLGSGRWADGSVFHAGADSGTNFVFQRPPQRTRIGALLIFTRLSLCGARHRSTFLFLVSEVSHRLSPRWISLCHHPKKSGGCSKSPEERRRGKKRTTDYATVRVKGNTKLVRNKR